MIPIASDRRTAIQVGWDNALLGAIVDDVRDM